LAQFLQNSNPKDEFFLISFNNRPDLNAPFTSDIEQLEAGTISLKPKGRTALLDAIYFGVAQMKSALHDRHILLVISDGGDNHSRHHEAEIRNVLKESDCQLYALGIFDAHDMGRTTEEREGPSLLSEFAEITGGHVFEGVELRTQYIIGYKPNDLRHDGGWRRIKVNLTPSNERPLIAHARTGYYSPRE